MKKIVAVVLFLFAVSGSSQLFGMDLCRVILGDDFPALSRLQRLKRFLLRNVIGYDFGLRFADIREMERTPEIAVNNRGPNSRATAEADPLETRLLLWEVPNLEAANYKLLKILKSGVLNDFIKEREATRQLAKLWGTVEAGYPEHLASVVYARNQVLNVSLQILSSGRRALEVALPVLGDCTAIRATLVSEVGELTARTRIFELPEETPLESTFELSLRGIFEKLGVENPSSIVSQIVTIHSEVFRSSAIRSAFVWHLLKDSQPDPVIWVVSRLSPRARMINLGDLRKVLTSQAQWNVWKETVLAEFLQWGMNGYPIPSSVGEGMVGEEKEVGVSFVLKLKTGVKIKFAGSWSYLFRIHRDGVLSLSGPNDRFAETTEYERSQALTITVEPDGQVTQQTVDVAMKIVQEEIRGRLAR